MCRKLVSNNLCKKFKVSNLFENFMRRNIKKVIQVKLIITLSLGSMETDHVIGEPCYNEVIYNRHIAKKLIWEP